MNKSSKFPSLNNLGLIGYMSVDGARQYQSNLSQLKYLTAIPQGKLSYDLNHNIQTAIKRTTDDNNEKINLLLQFLLQQSSRLEQFRTEWMFITYRRTLISVMCNAANPQPLSIIATLFDGAIYLCSAETPQEVQRRQTRNKQEEKFCAWGYKFEQYLLSDKPSLQPDIDRPVIENEEFSLYYTAALNQHKLLYGAQIDGMLADRHPVPDPPDPGTDEALLNYLQNERYVELKTNRIIHHYKQERSFKKYKLLRCWCQCYLAGLKGLLVGFRNDNGIIQKLQWFDTEDIVAYCQREWQPVEALRFLDYFLQFVKRTFIDLVEKIHGKNINLSTIDPISIHCEINDNNTIMVTQCDNKDMEILPEWYINPARKK